MSKWYIRFQIPEGYDEWVMDYPFEPDEETIITDIVEHQCQYNTDKINIISVKKIE